MLPKKNRVSKKLIGKIVREGKAYYTDSFTLRILKNTFLKEPQFVVIVPKKVNKSAVVRNTIKRKFKAAFLTLTKSSKFTPAYYCVVVKQDSLKDLKSQEIEVLMIGLVK